MTPFGGLRQSLARCSSWPLRSADTTSVGASPPSKSAWAAGSRLSDPASTTIASALGGSGSSSRSRKAGMPTAYASPSATATMITNRRTDGKDDTRVGRRRVEPLDQGPPSLAHRRPTPRDRGAGLCAALPARDDRRGRGGRETPLVRPARLDLDGRAEPPDRARLPDRRLPARGRLEPAAPREAVRVLGPRGVPDPGGGLAALPARDAGRRAPLVRRGRPHPSPPPRGRARRDQGARRARLASLRRRGTAGRDVGLEAGEADARAPLEPRRARRRGAPGLPAALRP